MSQQEEAEGREVVGEQMALCSPLDLGWESFFPLSPGPPSPGLCFSPQRNFWEDNHREFTGEIHVMTSTTNGLPRIEVPRSPGDHLGFCVSILLTEITRLTVQVGHLNTLIVEVQRLSVKLKIIYTFLLPHTHAADKNERNRLAEILELMTVVSENFKLTLAQAWIPTDIREVGSCGQSLPASASLEERLTKEACLSTSDLLFYVVDAHMWGFREASTEHKLLEGQGVVGRACLSLKSCFCKDVTQFQKTEYPLVEYAHMFELRSCFAVPICDNQTGKEIYILEFFLPPALADFGYQRKVFHFLSATINQSSPNLRIAHKLFGKGTIELIHLRVDKPSLSPENFQKQKTIKPSKCGRKNSLTFETIRCNDVPDMNSREQPGNQEVDFMYGKTKINGGERSLPLTISEKEDELSLEVLKQLYGNRLEDVAEYLGVGRSTIKRSCRKHGIDRWPSCKRKMTGRFSHKQTHKNELYQGSEGAVSCKFQNMHPVSSFTNLLTGARLTKKPKRKPESEEAGPSKKQHKAGPSSSALAVLPPRTTAPSGGFGRGKQLVSLIPSTMGSAEAVESIVAPSSSSSAKTFISNWGVKEDNRANLPTVVTEMLLKGVLPKNAEFIGKLSFERLTNSLATSFTATHATLAELYLRSQELHKIQESEAENLKKKLKEMANAKD